MFEIGDKVIVSNSLLLYYGGIGTIVDKRVCDNKTKYIVEFSNGAKDIFTWSDLLAVYTDRSRKSKNLSVKKVIFSGKKTILIFDDGSKSIVSCAESDTFDPYTGFCVAFTRAAFGSKAKIEKMIIDSFFCPSKETKKQEKELLKMLKELRKDTEFKYGDLVRER